MRHIGPGSITISRPSYGDGTKAIEIRVRDDQNHITFLELRISLEDFAEALTGLGQCPCQIEVYPDHIGKAAEHKTEFVPLDLAGLYTKVSQQAATMRALRPFEVDGWTAIGGRLWNSHYKRDVDGRPGYSVGFVRYVDPPASGPTDEEAEG